LERVRRLQDLRNNRTRRRKEDEQNVRCIANTIYNGVLTARKFAHRERPSDHSLIVSWTL
jgi:hypothetical protein